MQKKAAKLTNILLGIVYMLFIISFSVILVLNFKPLYYGDIKPLEIEDASGLSEAEIRENYDVLIEYNSMFYYDELEFPSLTMSEHGKTHFEEVKNIFVAVQYLCVICFFLIVLGTSWKSHLKEFGYFKIAGIFTVFIPAILGILIGLNWDCFFVTFHHIFFRNNYWIFDPALDPVITILPDAFFMHCAIAILVLVVIMASACMGACYVLKKRWKTL